MLKKPSSAASRTISSPEEWIGRCFCYFGNIQLSINPNCCSTSHHKAQASRLLLHMVQTSASCGELLRPHHRLPRAIYPALVCSTNLILRELFLLSCTILCTYIYLLMATMKYDLHVDVACACSSPPTGVCEPSPRGRIYIKYDGNLSTFTREKCQLLSALFILSL